MNYIFGLDSDEVEDFQDDFGEDGQAATEARWKRGTHITEKGREIALRDMEYSHLKNSIKYFQQKGYDTRPLEKELIKRNHD